ncbi:unnamed protein product [Protopolystoma xenopodis]|uniref:Uncharacterized protein n=1 Tax=Protopolystoma xenopodis TaxID=117903 RepID=A0A448XKK5_9PLAT|nr:unnamed protein product [Protopolystoma xenopodis]
MTDESLSPFHRNRVRLPRKQRRHESSNKANRQLVKRNRPSSSGGSDLRVSSLNTFPRNGSRLDRNPRFPRARHLRSGTEAGYESSIQLIIKLQIVSKAQI